jgi:hypothetical protein
MKEQVVLYKVRKKDTISIEILHTFPGIRLTVTVTLETKSIVQ